MTKAVIFDMDGLLIDSEPLWRSVEIEIFSEMGIALTDEMCRETTGMRIDQVVTHWLMRFPVPVSGEREAKRVENKIVERMREAIGSMGELMPGAVDAVKVARASGLKTAIASSSPLVLIEAMVQRFAFSAAFDVLHSAESEEQGKPNPAVYLSTASKLGVDAQDCIAVEDSVTGMTAAKAAGMLCIVVPDPKAELVQFGDADVVLDSLEGFGRTLARIV